MKRILLSCLTVLFVLSFGVVAKAQAPKLSKDIYMCIDDLRPIDLTWDVLGVNFNSTDGVWAAITPDPFPGGVPGSAYDGKNVFKAVSSVITVGTYVFHFTSNNDGFCGLASGEKAEAKVHVLPRINANKNAGTLEYCLNQTVTHSTNPVDYAFTTAEKDLITSIGGTFAVTSVTGGASVSPNWAFTTAALIPAPGTEYTAKVVVTYPAAVLASCGTETTVTMRFVVTDEERTLTPVTKTVCLDDIKGLADSPTMNFFRPGQQIGGATYDKDPIVWADLVAGGVAGSPYNFELEYLDCKTNTTKTVTDVINVIDAPVIPIAAGTVTANVCKLTATVDQDLYYLYNKFAIVGGVNLSPATAKWLYAGVKKDGSDLNGVLGNPFVSPDKVTPSKLSAGVNYYFPFYFDASATTCFVGDTLIVVGSDGIPSGDGRLQVCRPATGSLSNDVNLNELMGLTSTTAWLPTFDTDPITSPYNVVWTAPVATITDSTLFSTYTFKYKTISADCGGAEGSFFLKVSDNVIISDAISEEFCIGTTPEFVNVFNMIGTSSATIDAPSLAALIGYLNADGTLNIRDFRNDKVTTAPYPSIVIIFDGKDCLSTRTITLTIKFTDTL